MKATNDFRQIRPLCSDPLQHDYEVIRPVVLFAEPVTERSRETDFDRTTVSDKTRHFLEHGMLGLVDQRLIKTEGATHPFPDPVARHILYLKQLYPPLHERELVRIVAHRFGYHTNHHTLRHFLDTHSIPVQLELVKPPTFHDFESAYEARYEIIRLMFEGWQKTSIAGFLRLSRKQVGRIIAAFHQDEFAGLEEHRTRPPTHPANQMTLPLIKAVLDIQKEYPRAGRFRVQGLLAQRRAGEDTPSERTVGRVMAHNREHHGAPGPWPPPPEETPASSEVKILPYLPRFRHQYWFLDLRYLIQLDGHWIYSLCVIEGYSRKILAGMVSEYQDEVAVWQLLAAALAAYGAPGGLVSDNGGVFIADLYKAVLPALEIEPCWIEKGEPWQNLIEAQFKIQLRLADAKFEQAQSLEDAQQIHAAFIETFNTTPHWAHRDRDDGLKTPEAVLSGVRGRVIDPTKLPRLLRDLQFPRTVNRAGCVCIQRFYIYAEPGLAKHRVSVWIYEGMLRIEYQQRLLAQYHCAYDRRSKALQEVSQPKMYHTPFALPQLELLELDEAYWRRVWQRPASIHRMRSPVWAEQFPLLKIATFLVWLSSLLATNSAMRHLFERLSRNGPGVT